MLENKPTRKLDDAIMKDIINRATPNNTAGVRQAAHALNRKAEKIEKEMVLILDKYGHDPSVTGLGEFPAALPDDAWIRDATTLLNKEGPELYLRTMLDALRARLGGVPKLSSSNKNHPCPCGSTKKFGKCCGMLVEDADPDSCRVMGHTYGHWGQVKTGVWVHTCEECSAVETAAQALEIGCEDEKVVMIPCRACKNTPDHDAGWEIYSAVKKQSCIVCKQVPRIDTLVIEHDKDGKHSTQWEQSFILWADPCFQIELHGLLGKFIVHSTCLKAHGIEVNEKI